MTGSITSEPRVPAAGGGPMTPTGPVTPATPRAPSSPGVRRTVILLGGVILAVVLAGMVVVLAAGRPAATYPAGSPEAAFQGFFTAWQARDLDAAYLSFSDRIRGQVTPDEFRRMDADFSWARDSDRRVVLVGSVVTGDRATLDLRIDEFSSGGLLGGGGTWSWERSIPLIRENGAWHVDEYLAGLDPLPAMEVPVEEIPVEPAPTAE